jgi:tetratricopeptide (TPR) repeat protein
LHLIYLEQKDWVAAIECCQGIIEMPQLPPNSDFIVQAYMNCGFACRQLEDDAEALINYTKALELQEQHHPIRHPRTAKVHVELGILFSRIGDTATAMNHLQSTIVLDFPEWTSKAHEWIARLS